MKKCGLELEEMVTTVKTHTCTFRQMPVNTHTQYVTDKYESWTLIIVTFKNITCHS